MTGILWEYLHPLTRQRLSGALYRCSNHSRLDCGCHKRSTGLWHLCDYHKGFDEGAEAASAE